MERDAQGIDAWLARPAVHVGVLAVLAAVFCLVRVAQAPLAGDPAMYGTIAKTIAATGEWTHLTFNGEPYQNKPPLHFWLNALVFRVLPPTTRSAALLPGLLGVADALLVYALCRVTLPGWRTAFAAVLVYVTTPEVVHWSRGVHLETLVTFWVLLGLLAAYRSVDQPAALVALAVAAAGGWLAKGPQGLFALPVAAILWTQEGVLGRRLRSGWALAGAALALALTAPWLWARLSEGSGYGAAYFGGQIGHVLFRRGELGRGPLWYFGKLARTYWPWLPVALVGLVLLARRWRESRGARLWLVYTTVVLAVISLAAGKKSRYLFQLYPALAVAAGVTIGAVAERRPRLLLLVLVPAAVAALVVASVGGARPKAEQAATVRAVLAVADDLRDAESGRVWLTRKTQHGRSGLGKVLGFHARPLLETCRSDCRTEARPGDLVVARARQLERVARRLGGTVRRRTDVLGVVEVGARP
jgi:4-amino-4-deoxy-L-arabinose transferase-like glycosyltransferase